MERKRLTSIMNAHDTIMLLFADFPTTDSVVVHFSQNALAWGWIEGTSRFLSCVHQRYGYCITNHSRFKGAVIKAVPVTFS